MLKATHQGKIKIGEKEIPCAVLEDGTRVLSETGITNAVLGGRSGASILLAKELKNSGSPLPIFLASNNLKPFIHRDLLDGPLARIEYINSNNKIVTGFTADALPAVCNIWLEARAAGVLMTNQLDKAQTAEIMMRGLAHIGIVALVDEATGYQADREQEALQKLLSAYLSEERLKWAKMFPDEFYKQLFRLKGWSYNPMSVKRPQIVGKLTNLLIYEKLPPGVLEELKRLNPIKNKRTGRREATHHQHLTNDIGQRDLHDHLMQVIAIMRISKNWNDFMNNFEKAFGNFVQDELDFDSKF